MNYKEIKECYPSMCYSCKHNRKPSYESIEEGYVGCNTRVDGDRFHIKGELNKGSVNHHNFVFSEIESVNFTLGNYLITRNVTECDKYKEQLYYTFDYFLVCCNKGLDGNIIEYFDFIEKYGDESWSIDIYDIMLERTAFESYLKNNKYSLNKEVLSCFGRWYKNSSESFDFVKLCKEYKINYKEYLK